MTLGKSVLSVSVKCFKQSNLWVGIFSLQMLKSVSLKKKIGGGCILIISSVNLVLNFGKINESIFCFYRISWQWIPFNGISNTFYIHSGSTSATCY